MQVSSIRILVVLATSMEVTATSKYLRISPRKVRPLALAIKKLSVVEAVNRLRLLPKKGGNLILETLESAVANATSNTKLNKENLKIKNILVDEGFKMKRRDTSHGARYGGGVIQKKTSHITVVSEG